MRNILIFNGILFVVIVLVFGCNSDNNKGKIGYEYQADSVYFGNYTDWKNIDFNYCHIGASAKYFNHTLYCFDTISQLEDFVFYFFYFSENSFVVNWGPSHHDVGNVNRFPNLRLTEEQFKILKYNTIHGASVIVNSCLFNKYIPKEKDKKYLNKKYFEPNSYHRYISDSQFEEMRYDIEKMCKRLEDYY